MIKHKAILVREGRVRYVDLCKHMNISREEFFGEAKLKKLSVWGLVLEDEDLVKILFNDDSTDNTESEGIVIPRSCVIDITYFGESEELEPVDGDVN